MNIRVQGEFLDFNDDVEVEKRIKLFEEISTTDGDVSFAFQIPNTPENLKKLTYPLADTVKQIYTGLEAEIFNLNNLVYKGVLRVESVTKQFISCSFFSGNSSWFALISGQLYDLDFSELDQTLNASNIRASWDDTSGIKYPIIDAGVVNRNGSVLRIEDFVPFIFVKDVFKKIFNTAGIKIQGELIEDPIFNALLVSGNNPDSSGITSRTVYAGKIVTQSFSGATPVIVTFPVESDPYFDGDSNLWNGQRFTADVGMVVDIDLSALCTSISVLAIVTIFKNTTAIGAVLAVSDGTKTLSLKSIQLAAGDYIEVKAEGTMDIDSGSIRITPRFVYYTFGNTALPNWTQQEFVSNILAKFNVITSFDDYSRTVTFNLFDKIKEKTPIDISQYVTVSEVNYERFAGVYNRQNVLRYEEADIQEIEDYNKINAEEYGSGVIETDNRFLDERDDIIESDFAAPFSYVHPGFNMSIEKMNFNEFEVLRSFQVTQVNNDSDDAEIVVPSGHGIIAGDIVRIENSTVTGYNGVWMVESVDTTSFKIFDMPYISDADFDLELLYIARTNNTDTFLLIDSGPLALSEFSDNGEWDANGGVLIFSGGSSTVTAAEPAIGFFNLLNLGYSINDFFKDGLFFGSINNEQSYQRSIIDNYWRLFTRILSDPVTTTVEGNLPLHIFMAIDFLRPLRIKTQETSNLYYCNVISGYKGQDRPCEIELIKL